MPVKAAQGDYRLCAALTAVQQLIERDNGGASKPHLIKIHISPLGMIGNGDNAIIAMGCS